LLPLQLPYRILCCKMLSRIRSPSVRALGLVRQLASATNEPSQSVPTTAPTSGRPPRPSAPRKQKINPPRTEKKHIKTHQKKNHGEPRKTYQLSTNFENETKTCAQHLDPQGMMLPTSDWIHVDGILPNSSLEMVVDTFSKVLVDEQDIGIVDLDALWNPVEDPAVPTLAPLDNNVQNNWIQAAHLVLSPFGRPTGWYLKFPNRSIVNSIVSHAQLHPLFCAWKPIKVTEYKYRQEPLSPNPTVSDSMIRFENTPRSLSADQLRLMLSRYELATEGNTVVQWKGSVEGKTAPLMFVVRFADASWARAALRDMQSTMVENKNLVLAQYPRQIRCDEGTTATATTTTTTTTTMDEE
jgi:hypothetical protein